MYLNANENPLLASKFILRNIDTNKIIEHVLWADDITGKYAQYIFDEFGNLILDEYNNPLLKIKIEHIKLEEIK